jgi:hypothetical protein
MNYLEFDIGTAVLTEYDKDGYPTVQVDSYGEEKSGTRAYELHSPHGLISRCFDPKTDAKGSKVQGCAVLYALDGGQGHAWLQSDPRVIPLLPPIEKGGTCLYGGKIKNPGFYNMDGLTGSHTIYVPYRIVNDVPLKAMTISINVDTEGQESIAIIHGSGASFSIAEELGEISVTMAHPDGAYVEVNAEGVVVNGPLTVNGSLNAGGPVGATPLALAAPLATALTSLASALALITDTAGPGAAAAAKAASSAISAALALIPAKNTSGM